MFVNSVWLSGGRRMLRAKGHTSGHVRSAFAQATLLTARKLSGVGGQTEFANTYAAYEHLSEADKSALDGVMALHTIEASMRPVFGQQSEEQLERWRNMGSRMVHPLVWTHESGRKSLVIGTHADSIVGRSLPEGASLLVRLQEWAGRPEISPEAFREYYETVHARIGEEIASKVGVCRYFRRYVDRLSPAGAADVHAFPYDVITEVWFDNREDFERAVSSVPQGELPDGVASDEERFLDRAKTRFITVEECESDLEVLRR